MPVARRAPAKLRGGPQFRRVLQGGRRAAGELLIVHVLREQVETRAGFIAGRGVGGAVVRNRARRLIREAWRMVDPAVRPGTHAVLVALPGIRTARTGEVTAELAGLLRKIGVVD